jgi:hypothetical protein
LIDSLLKIQHIRNMPNTSKQGVSAAQVRFVDDVACLLVPWGMPQIAARLYGYLLLRVAPVGLDRISADLEISKSSASVAARLLERHTLARRHGERGSKRVLYSVSDNYAGVLSEQSSLLGDVAVLLQNRAAAVASGTTAIRLEAMSRFYLSMREAMEKAIRDFNADVPSRKI